MLLSWSGCFTAPSSTLAAVSVADCCPRPSFAPHPLQSLKRFRIGGCLLDIPSVGGSLTSRPQTFFSPFDYTKCREARCDPAVICWPAIAVALRLTGQHGAGHWGSAPPFRNTAIVLHYSRRGCSGGSEGEHIHFHTCFHHGGGSWLSHAGRFPCQKGWLLSD